MPATQRRHSKDDLDRMEREVYERVVKPRLRPEDDGRFVAVDALTGEFEVDDIELTAVRRLKARVPEAEVWLDCIGQPTTYRIGGSSIRGAMERAHKQRGDRYRYDWKLPKHLRWYL